MSPYFTAMLGAFGMFIGLDIITDSPWGFSALVSGLFLFSTGVIQEART